MSAEVLREAARVMRERADVATVGPWTGEPIGSEGHRVFGPEGSRRPLRGRAIVASCNWQDWEESAADAEHIASWHPAVALAVADWLISVYCATTGEWVDGYTCAGPVGESEKASALTVARAYLGDPS